MQGSKVLLWFTLIMISIMTVSALSTSNVGNLNVKGWFNQSNASYNSNFSGEVYMGQGLNVTGEIYSDGSLVINSVSIDNTTISRTYDKHFNTTAEINTAVNNVTIMRTYDESTLNVNSSTFWQNANSILAKWFSVVANVFTFNEALLNETIDVKDVIANTSMSVYVGDVNGSMTEYVNAQDHVDLDNTTISRTYDKHFNTTAEINTAVDNNTIIRDYDEPNLNVNSSTFWADVSSYMSKWFSDVANVFTFNEALLNETIDVKIDSDNTSITGYINVQDSAYNVSIYNTVVGVNGSMTEYSDTKDAAQDSCSEITGCIENALVLANLDNGTIIRTYNGSWVLSNQGYNTSAEIWDVINNNTYYEIGEDDNLIFDISANGTYQYEIGNDCAASNFAKGVDDDGTLDCAVPTDTTYTAEEFYIYLDGTVFRINETILNTTINNEDTDTTYTEDSIYLTLAGTVFGFTESVLNGTINHKVLVANNSMVAYVVDVNESITEYSDTKDAAQDACSEITGCIENALVAADLNNATIIREYNGSWVLANQAYNTTAEINTAVDNTTISRTYDKLFNTTAEINTAMNNVTIVRSYDKLFNTTGEINTAVNNATISRTYDKHFNTTAEMGLALNNGTIIRDYDTSWITSNQNYGTLASIWVVADNGTFYYASNPDGYITSFSDTNASTACSGGNVLFGNGTCGPVSQGAVDHDNATIIRDYNTSWVTSNQNFGTTALVWAVADNSTFQYDIGSNCSVGNFVMGVASDGTLDCDAPSGSGDITTVNTTLPYLTGGEVSGDVILDFAESALNGTIDHKVLLANNSIVTFIGDSAFLTVESDPIWKAWDNFTGIPSVTPANGQSTSFSTADQIYDWVIGLAYATTTAVENSTIIRDYDTSWITTNQNFGTAALVWAVADNGTFQYDIGSNCSAGDYVLGVNDIGGLDCSTPPDTTYSESSIYLTEAAEVFGFSEAVLNGTIDHKDLLANNSIVTFIGDSAFLTVETDPFFTTWDNITGIPTATPSNGDTTHLSTADQIYDWTIGLGYASTAEVENATILRTYDEASLDVNSATFWASVSSFLAKWFSDAGNVLTFNEALLNTTIDVKDVAANNSVVTFVTDQGYTTNAGTVTAVTGTAPITSSEGTTPAIGITVAKDLVTTAPLTGAEDNIFPGADADVTIAITMLGDLATTAPLTGAAANIFPGSNGNKATIAMPVATTSVDGYLSQTDWDTFNTKGDMNDWSDDLTPTAGGNVDTNGFNITLGGIHNYAISLLANGAVRNGNATHFGCDLSNGTFMRCMGCGAPCK